MNIDCSDELDLERTLEGGCIRISKGSTSITSPCWNIMIYWNSILGNYSVTVLRRLTSY